MKKLITGLLIGSLLSACGIDSDPSKGTKYNFKNGLDSKVDANIEQLSSSDCTSFFSVDIKTNYNLHHQQETPPQLVAYTKLRGVKSKLVLVENESNPKGLAIVPSLEEGVYNIEWDTSNVIFSKYYEEFKFKVIHKITGKELHKEFFDRCEVANVYDTQVTVLKSRKDLPIRVSDDVFTDLSLSDEAKIFNINAGHKFEINLNANGKKSSLNAYELEGKDQNEYEDLLPYINTRSQNGTSGQYIVEVDFEKLTQDYNETGFTDLHFALNLVANVENESRNFVLKFKYKLPYDLKNQTSIINSLNPSPSEAIRSSPLQGRSFTQNEKKIDTSSLSSFTKSKKIKINDFTKTKIPEGQ